MSRPTLDAGATSVRLARLTQESALRIRITGAIAAAGVAFMSVSAAGAADGRRERSSVPTRIIGGTTIVGDSDSVLWEAVLDILPFRPKQIEVLDLDSLSDGARTKLRGVDGFVLAGQTTVVVIRQGATLRQAAFGDDVDRLVLASLVWHEMAHARGSDECAAEEALWRKFIATRRVQHEVGMAYLARLRETAADRTRVNESGPASAFCR